MLTDLFSTVMDRSLKYSWSVVGFCTDMGLFLTSYVSVGHTRSLTR